MNTDYDFRMLAVWNSETVIWFHNISSYMTRDVNRWERKSFAFRNLKRTRIKS